MVILVRNQEEASEGFAGRATSCTVLRVAWAQRAGGGSGAGVVCMLLLVACPLTPSCVQYYNSTSTVLVVVACSTRRGHRGEGGRRTHTSSAGRPVSMVLQSLVKRLSTWHGGQAGARVGAGHMPHRHRKEQTLVRRNSASGGDTHGVAQRWAEAY